MAAGTIKTKGQLTTDIDSIIVAGGNIDAVDLNGILQNIVASYEDIIRDYTTVQRNALTPVESQIIYNTTSNRLEYYSASMWLPCSQKETIAVDCSANPNYPEALCGDQYIVTVAGKIGGGSGADVYVGDLVTCTVANAGGTQAGVGSSWKITHSASSTDSPTYFTELILSSSDVNALYTNPRILVSAAGSGKIIVPINIIVYINYNSIPYSTNTSLRALIDDNNSLVIGDLSYSANHYKVTPFSYEYETYDNLDLKVTVASGNPSGGDSIIKIKCFYKIVTL